MTREDLLKRLEPYYFKVDFTEQDMRAAMDALFDALDAGAVTRDEALELVQEYPALDVHPSPVYMWESTQQNEPPGIC